MAGSHQGSFSVPDDLNRPDCTIAGEIGCHATKCAIEKLPDANVVEYSSALDALPALLGGKVDALVYDKPNLDNIAALRSDLVVIPQILGAGHISIGASLKQRELMKQIDAFVLQYQQDGTYDEMYNRWIKTKNPKMPDIPRAANPDGKLIVGVVDTYPPLSYYDENHELTGFDIEVTKRLALFLNMDFEFRKMNYESMFMACESGKVDVAIAQLDYTPERAESMLFSLPYINADVALLIRAEDYKAPATETAQNSQAEDDQCSFHAMFQSIGNSFHRTFVHENRWELIVKGLGITLIITFFAGIVGTVLAFPVCFVRQSKGLLTHGLGSLYVSLMQGTPILVILMILYYVVFAKVDINAVFVAIIAFGLNFSAYAGEMLRTGISGVPDGQREAALALGLTPHTTFWKIIIPQALRQILPVYRGEFINMLKSTSIVGYIAIQDLTKMSDIIRSRTYEAFFPLISTAAIYFIVAWLLTRALSCWEHHLDPARRRARHSKTLMPTELEPDQT